MGISMARRYLPPATAGVFGALPLTGLYFGIVSWGESPYHALALFWEDRLIVTPLVLGLGVQVALHTVLKMRLFVPVVAVAAILLTWVIG